MQETEQFPTHDAYFRTVFKLVDERLALYDRYLEIRKNQKVTEDSGNEYRKLELENQGLIQKALNISKKSAQTVKNGLILPLEYLFRCFQMTPFERHCVFLSLAAELNTWYEKKYSYYLEDYEKKRPTIDFCIDSYTFGNEQRTPLLEEVIARKENYIYFFFLGKGEIKGLISEPLYLEPRILSFLFQYNELDENLRSFCHVCFPDPRRAEPLLIRKEILEQMERLSAGRTENTIFYLHGMEGAGKKTIVRHYCQKEKKQLLFVDMIGFGRLGLEKNLMQRIIREARIRMAYLCFYHFEKSCFGTEGERGDAGGTYFIREFEQFLPETQSTLFLLGNEEWRFSEDGFKSRYFDFGIEPPEMSERMLLWDTGLSRLPKIEGITKESLAAKFAFSPGQIMASMEEFRQVWEQSGKGPVTPEMFYAACRKQIVKQVQKLTTPIQSKFTWDDLVLPEYQKNALKAACNQVEYQHKIYEEWGFQEKVSYGRGVSMLFYGPPGTGKTMGAQVIANQLHLELYKVEIAAVLSKYIGETEKNLNAVFEEVKKSQSILFFDEADALFGKRSEVKDSHDKYANAETAYLLQKMEEYDGIVILATNLKQNFDEAFRRRIKFMIEFPFPGCEERYAMWKQVFPKKAPVSSEMDYAYLAEQFELSGASIKNIAVAAAFLAASGEQEIGMTDVLRALVEEMKKSGKNLQRDDIGEYYYLLQKRLS